MNEWVFVETSQWRARVSASSAWSALDEMREAGLPEANAASGFCADRVLSIKSKAIAIDTRGNFPEFFITMTFETKIVILARDPWEACEIYNKLDPVTFKYPVGVWTDSIEMLTGGIDYTESARAQFSGS